MAGFAAAFFLGDLFLAVRAAPTSSVEFFYGVAGFSLAQIFWTLGQLREARPDGRVFVAVAVPLALFVLARLCPPVLSPAAEAMVCLYSVLTALSFATALATRRVFYGCGIGLLLFSDLMIGGHLLRAPGCGMLIGPTYLMAEACLLTSFFWRGEKRFSIRSLDIRWFTLTCGVLAFVCFIVAAVFYPGGGYNPFTKMLSALGRTVVRKVAYPACHFWFLAGITLAVVSVSRVWVQLATRAYRTWRRVAFVWGGAVNVAGLLTLALVPENVNVMIHNAGCHMAVIGGAAILAARFRKGGDRIWTIWLLSVVFIFCVCLLVKGIPFSPWVTSFQKLLIVSFAAWAGWIAWWERAEDREDGTSAP